MSASTDKHDMSMLAHVVEDVRVLYTSSILSQLSYMKMGCDNPRCDTVRESYRYRKSQNKVSNWIELNVFIQYTYQDRHWFASTSKFDSLLKWFLKVFKQEKKKDKWCIPFTICSDLVLIVNIQQSRSRSEGRDEGRVSGRWQHERLKVRAIVYHTHDDRLEHALH